MKKELLISSTRIICLSLFTSVFLISSPAWSQVPDTARQGSLVRVPIYTVAEFRSSTVPQLYGTQDRSRQVQSVSYLSGRRLESSPVSLLSNSFSGQFAGLYSNQNNGAPRHDNPALSLRGRNPLVVVDGIPRYNLVDGGQTYYDVLSINPEQVESVTLLKDGLSTVMLGNRGMNGVLMVTTRNRGSEKDPYIWATAQTGVQTPIGMRDDMLSSYEYAQLYNEASVNSGGSALYSQAQLDAYKNGTDPHLYPDVNWRQALMKSNALNQRYNLSAAGNYLNIKYFMSLDYQWQEGLLKENPASKEQTNVDYKRYIFRTNFDIKFDTKLSANLNVTANIQDYVQPGVGYQSLFSSILNTPNNATPIYNANGTYAGTRNYPTNPYANLIGTGRLQNNQQAASVDVSFKRTLEELLKGSWAKATMSYSPSYEQRVNRSLNYDAYDFPSSGDSVRVSTISARSSSSSILERFQQAYAELSMGIERSWGTNSFTGILVGSYDNLQSEGLLNQIYQGISTRLAYSYDQRFNLEAGASYSGNNWFAKGNQFDFYPAGGISWNMHNESFLKGSSSINELKLRASYARVGNANPGYYLFNQSYTGGSSYVFGSGATSASSLAQSDLASPNRVTEKSNKLNVGLDLAYSQDRGWFNVDYYKHRESDLLQERGGNSSLLGQVYPDENIGKNEYSGIEINTGWAAGTGNLHYAVSGNFSTVASRIIFNDEPTQPYAHSARTGSPVNQIRGFQADGFFNSGNLNTASMTGYTPSVGDTKYKDLNSDGVIDVNDQTVIGNDKPLMFFGASLGLELKGLDMKVLFQGVSNRDIVTTGNYQFPFTNQGKGQAYQYNLGRYTPATAASATMPRVTLGTDQNNYIAPSSSNNNITSSLFVRNGNYIRLKNVELGYTFGNKFSPSSKIKGIRVFVNGQNLVTFSKYKEADPEDYTGLYPLQRIINGGLSIKL